jgi:hypothetical protein
MRAFGSVRRGLVAWAVPPWMGSLMTFILLEFIPYHMLPECVCERDIASGRAIGNTSGCVRRGGGASWHEAQVPLFPFYRACLILALSLARARHLALSRNGMPCHVCPM